METEGIWAFGKRNRGKMDIEEGEPKENGLRERGTEGRWVKIKGNQQKMG